MNLDLLGLASYPYVPYDLFELSYYYYSFKWNQ